VGAPVIESRNAVFLSYAAQDAEAAQRICATLYEAGVEVWFDRSELRGGDVWDQKIRREILDCALFVPIISANTQARLEGYFRREWRLAASRTHDMADEKPFIVPVVIDGTNDQDARVPEQFRAVQWTSIPAGGTSAAFVERILDLLTPAATVQPVFAAQRSIPEKSIAVLPFADMSAQKDQEYFSDGLAEALIDMLTQVQDLRVPARTSSFSFKGKPDDIASIAQKLRVAHVLEGSVRKAGNTIRVTVHLIRTDDGYHLWSKTYERNIEDIFKVQDEIASIVVETLKARLFPARGVINPHRTSSLDAYEQYLLAKQFYNRNAVDGAHRAEAALQHALALDPGYASAYALLAIIVSQGIVYGDAAGQASAERAATAAEKAVALAPSLGEAYSARSLVRSLLLWEWNGAKADLERAVQLDPRSEGTQRRYGLLLATLGRLPEAMSALQTATEIEPLDFHAWLELGWVQTAAGQLAAGRSALRRALELSPTSTTATMILSINQLVAGEPSEALKTNNKQQLVLWRVGVQAAIEHNLGQIEASQRKLEDLIGNYGRRAPSLIATVFASRGDVGKAFEWLERAYECRDAPLSTIQFHPWLAVLRSDPRYKALLRKMNFPE
jgi:TolB-like protein/Tfp pilus assembly protein PilF